jgi:hypothetical protein
MDKATSEPRTCEVCGKRLYRNNKSGFCSGGGSPAACKSARNKAARCNRQSRALPESAREACAVCGGKLRADNKVGVCRRTPECRQEIKDRRRRAARKIGPADRRASRERPRRVPAVPAGTAFGRWVTLEESPKGGNGKVLCRCECERGTEARVLVGNLKRGVSRSCGCLKRESVSRPRSPDGIYLLAGSVSGRLTTLEDAAKSRNSVRVRCECGTETVKNAQLLKSGKIRSCGCMPRETLRTHGLSGHPLYNIWKGIVRRCTNPADKAYARYGAIGRGICAGWLGMPDGFLAFAADMAERPPGLSVNRVNNSGGYWCGHCRECIRLRRPANCEWATREEQAANKGSGVQVIRERDDYAARLAEAERLLAAPGRKRTTVPAAQDTLF